MWYGAGGEENEVRGGEWKEEYGGHIVAQVGGIRERGFIMG